MELFLDVPRNAQDTSRLVFQSLEAKKMPFCSLDKSDVPMKIAYFFKWKSIFSLLKMALYSLKYAFPNSKFEPMDRRFYVSYENYAWFYWKYVRNTFLKRKGLSFGQVSPCFFWGRKNFSHVFHNLEFSAIFQRMICKKNQNI